MTGPAVTRPQVIVPVTAAALPELLAAMDVLAAPLFPRPTRDPGVPAVYDVPPALRLASDAVDVIEWRLDAFLNAAVPGYAEPADAGRSAVLEAWRAMRTRTNLPVLVTIRTRPEGGLAKLSDAAYGCWLNWLVAAGIGDLVDLEWRRRIDHHALILAIRAAGRASVLSAHDFERTPSQPDLEDQFVAMAAPGPDFVKVACMPVLLSDTLVLMRATRRMAGLLPVRLITMAMGDLGVLSRVLGHLYGSAATFAALTDASAPGQLPLPDLDALLSAIPEAESGGAHAE